MHIAKGALYRMLTGLPPALFGALALLNGIIGQLFQQQLAMIAVGIILGEVLCQTHHWNRSIAWLAVILISCCGALRLASQQAQYLNETRTIPYGLCSVQGILLDTGLTKNKTLPFYLYIRTHSIVSLHDPKKKITSPVILQIAVQSDPSLSSYTTGTILELSHVALIKPYTANNYYLMKNNVHCSGKMAKEGSIKSIQSGPLAILQNLNTMRHSIIEVARSCFSPQAFILTSEMFFGYPSRRNELHRTIHESFSWWGLSHLLARSGLHLIMFALLFGFMTNFIPLPFFYKHALILVAIFMYMILSWPSVPFIRAISMMTWYVLCLGIRSAPHPLHIIACVMMGMLLYQPWYIIGLDFQLSFSLAFALALINHANKIT